MKELRMRDRTIYFDYLRVFAAFAVMMLHISSYNWYSTDVNGLEWQIFNFYDSIVRWGVPVFIMISGALFLRREISISTIFSKYVIRLLISFATWSFVYYLFGGNSVGEQLQKIFQNGKTQQLAIIIRGHYHLWFIPMLVGIYICIPIIKQIVKNRKVVQYFLGLSFVFWFLLPEILMLVEDFGSEKMIIIGQACKDYISTMNVNLVMGYVVYFVLGYYLSNIRFCKKQRIGIYLLGIMGFLFTIVVDSVLAIKTQVPVSTYYGNSCVNILFEAVAIFEFFKNIPFRNSHFSVFIVKMSTWSFGAYLVHVLIIRQLGERLGLTSLSFHPLVSVPVIGIIVFLCSFGVSALLHCIPYVKKYMV